MNARALDAWDRWLTARRKLAELRAHGETIPGGESYCLFLFGAFFDRVRHTCENPRCPLCAQSPRVTFKRRGPP